MDTCRVKGQTRCRNGCSKCSTISLLIQIDLKQTIQQLESMTIVILNSVHYSGIVLREKGCSTLTADMFQPVLYFVDPYAKVWVGSEKPRSASRMSFYKTSHRKQFIAWGVYIYEPPTVTYPLHHLTGVRSAHWLF